jgi:hypothetical protein
MAGEVDSSGSSGWYMAESLVLGRVVHNFAGVVIVDLGHCEKQWQLEADGPI